MSSRNPFDRDLYEAAERQRESGSESDDDDSGGGSNTTDLTQRERDLLRGSGPTIDDDGGSDSNTSADDLSPGSGFVDDGERVSSDDDSSDSGSSGSDPESSSESAPDSSGESNTSDLTQRERDLTRGSGPTIDDDGGGGSSADDSSQDLEDISQRQRDLLRGSGPTVPDEPIDSDELETDTQSPTDAQRELIAEQTDLDPQDIAGFVDRDDGVDVLLTQAARQERAAADIDGISADDIMRVDSDGVMLTRDARRRQAAQGIEGVSAEDIRSVEDGDVELTDEARVRQAREQFKTDPSTFDWSPDFDPQSGRLERIANQRAENTPGLSQFDVEELRFEATDDGVAITPTDQALNDRAAEREAQIREAAAEEDPIRDADDFIVEDGEIRRRADPFFDEQREALGIDLPGGIDEWLTTDRGESRIRRGLQRSSAQFSDVAGTGSNETPGAIAAQSVGDGGEFSDFGSNLRTGGAEVFNIPGGILGAAAVAEQGANVVQAEIETRRELLRDDINEADDGNAITDPTDAPDAFDASAPEGSAAAEERAATAEALEQTGETVVETARERPGVIVGGLAAGAALSVGSGLALGRGVRAASGRVRTAGGTRIDAGDIVNPSTRRVFDDGAPGDRFPRFRDEDLARSNPPEAVRRQADEFTPDELEQRFDDAGATEGSVLFKALDTEPTGPESRRAAQGLRTQEGGFESPGAFVGPELSPNFLRLSTERGFSVRPGLPDTGGRPTAVAVRTDVDAPDADTLGEFNQELLDRSGETTARTKPRDEVNVGEAEAVIPGDATFQDVGGGPVRNTLRRVGVGSDFFTEVGGQRIPIRTVAPETDDARSRSFLGDERGQVGGGGGGGDRAAFSGDLREIGRAPRAPVDRPTPVAGASGSPGGVDTDDGSTREPTETTTTSEQFEVDSDTSPTSTRSAIDLEPSLTPPTSSTRSDSGGESSGGGGTSGSRGPSRPSASDPIGVPSGSSPGGSSSSGGSPASGGSPSPPGSPPGSPGSPASPGSPLGPPSNAPPSTGPPSTRTGRPPRRDSDRPDDDLSAFSSDDEEFIKRFEFGVASPGEVLAGDELDTGAGDSDPIDEDLGVL